MLPSRALAEHVQRHRDHHDVLLRPADAAQGAGPAPHVARGDRRQPGTNCIKTGLPGKLILNMRKGLREVLFSWKYTGFRLYGLRDYGQLYQNRGPYIRNPV